MTDNLENTKAPETAEESNAYTQAEEKVTMTKAELDDLLQKSGDRRVSQALKTAEIKHQQKLKESEKLARMNAEEKFQYELEQREKAIEAKEKELALAENKNEASKILAEKGISLALVGFVVDESADAMNDKIKLLEAEFKKSVKEEVEKRLAGSSPKKNLPPDHVLDRESFRKMSLKDQMEVYKNNPQLYAELTKK